MSYKQSEHVKIRDVNTDIERAYNVLVDYTFDVGIKDKDALRFRLLTEEVLRLVKQILDCQSIELWFEGDEQVSRILVDTRSNLEGSKKDELGSIATSGKITEEKGFFKKITDMFLIPDYTEKSWSLKDYKAELKAKKEEDKFSMDAWEDLERSLVANLADDIEIKSSDNHIRMIVTKDFSQSLSLIPSSALLETSSLIVIGTGKDITNELNRAEDIISEISLDKKNAMRAKLVFEETLGMLKEMAENFQAVVWLEKYKKSYCIKLTIKTDIDFNKKNEFLSLSTDHKNDSVKGFMDKVGDVIQNSLLGYENTVKLSQQYSGGYVNYGTMGIYGSLESMQDYGVMWSLENFRSGLDDAMDSDEASKQAWDELEKSIVANIASDVIVGVKGDRVDMSIICKLV